MITTVTLNAAIDKTFFISGFKDNKVNRVQTMFNEPGGKGINVAKVLKTLNTPVQVAGFVGGYNGEYICESLTKRGIKQQFVKLKEESRLCLNIIDKSQGIQTEILEKGPTVSEKYWEPMRRKIEQLAKESKFVIFSGSVPKGLKSEIYKELIEIVQSCDSKAILDTSGRPLKLAIQAKPYMIKPNKDELKDLLNKKSLNKLGMIEAMKRFGDMGIHIVIVSLGNDGALANVGGTFYQVTPPPIQPVNTVGCGDAMVAGIAAGLYQELDIEEALIMGTAVAAANALDHKAGFVNPNQIEKFKSEVIIKRL